MKFRRSTLVWVGALAFLMGIITARYVSDVSPVLYAVATVCVFGFRRQGLLALTCVFISLFSLGLVRSEHWKDSLNFTDSIVGESVTVSGRVISDSVFDERRQTEFEIDRITITLGDRQERVEGKMRIQGFGVPSVQRYDEIVASGKLRNRFSTRVGSISFAEIEVTGRTASYVESFRRSFSAQLFTGLPDQEASLALGILVGQRTAIDDSVEDNLRVVGLTHIIAVSGYNLSVLVRLVRRRLHKLSKFQSTVLSGLLVVVFLLIAGGAASIVRAAWVIGLSLAAWYYGRNIRPIVLLMLSAAATAWFNPMFVWFDLGWWLSFAAFFGVLMVGPQLTARIYKDKEPNFFIKIAIESFAATIMTAPLIVWIFERVSIVSLASNIVVVPIVPFIMVTAFAAGLALFISGRFLLTKLLIFIASAMLGFVLAFAETVARLPFSEVRAGLTFVQMILVYSLIIACTFVLHRKTTVTRQYDLLE